MTTAELSARRKRLSRVAALFEKAAAAGKFDGHEGVRRAVAGELEELGRLVGVELTFKSTSAPKLTSGATPCPQALRRPLDEVVSVARDVRSLHAAYINGEKAHGLDVTADLLAQRMGRHALSLVRASEEMRSVELEEKGRSADCLDYAERAAPGVRLLLDYAGDFLSLYEDGDGRAPDVFAMPAAGKEFFLGEAAVLASAAASMLEALEDGPAPQRPKKAKPAKAKPSTAKRTQKTKPSERAFTLRLDEIHVDAARFQPREGAFAEETIRNIVEGFDARKLDELHVWQDPSDKKWYVLAGHSRREALRRLIKKGELPKSHPIPVRAYPGTEAEAVAHAHTENDSGTALTNAERAAYVRQLREDTDLNLSDIKEQAERLYGRDHTTVIALSYLSPRGKALSTLRQLTGNSTGEARDAETMAVWIGKLRRYREELTGSHENEIYAWLLENYKTQGRKLTSFIEFREYVERIIGRRSFMGEFDASKPLNFGDVPEKSRQEIEIDRALQEARAELRQAQRDLEEKREWALQEYDEIGPDQLRILLEEENDTVTWAQREVLRLEDEAGRARRTLAATESSLFDVLRENPALEACAIVTENSGRGGIEIRFPEDPGADVLDVLKKAGFLFYTPTDAPAFWAATSTPARRAIAARLDRAGDFARENPEAFLGPDLFSLGPYVYLGRALEVETTAGRYYSRGDDFMFTDAMGQQLLIVPAEYVEEVTGAVDDDAAEAFYELWNGFEPNGTDYRITIPEDEMLPAGHAEWMLYESDKITRPGDAEGRMHYYRHEFDEGLRPAMTIGKALLVSNLRISRRGILN